MTTTTSDAEPATAPTPSFDVDLYERLRGLAGSLLGGERAGHTLSATALVHEAFLRLRRGDYPSPAAYYSAAAEAMRRTLVDHARARAAVKRGGHDGRAAGRVRWEDVGDAATLAAQDRCAEILDLDAAILRLEEEDAQSAALVRLRFYAGLDLAEAAASLGVSPSTAKRDWRFARARLFRLLADPVAPT